MSYEVGGFTGMGYEPAGIIHRGEQMIPDGAGGVVHAYADGEVIYHYRTFEEFYAVLEDGK